MNTTKRKQATQTSQTQQNTGGWGMVPLSDLNQFLQLAENIGQNCHTMGTAGIGQRRRGRKPKNQNPNALIT